MFLSQIFLLKYCRNFIVLVTLCHSIIFPKPFVPLSSELKIKVRPSHHRLLLSDVHIYIVGFDFGVLLIWTAISCITLMLFEFGARRRDINVAQRKEVQREMPKAGGV